MLIRLMVVDILLDAGFTVVEASNADEALDLLRTQDVDLLFTDVRMPGSMSGLELAELVRREFSDIPVVLTSGHLKASQRPSGTEFVRKPYDPEHIAHLLARGLRSGSSTE